jgi:hypothetical protein
MKYFKLLAARLQPKEYPSEGSVIVYAVAARPEASSETVAGELMHFPSSTEAGKASRCNNREPRSVAGEECSIRPVDEVRLRNEPVASGWSTHAR